MTTDDTAATVYPHSMLLRRGVLLCVDSVPDCVVHVPESGICPAHNNSACPMWFVPWAAAKQASLSPDTAESKADAECGPKPTFCLVVR